ncbi:MAG TPA: lysylphosphatidylglycerol synthase transmembrane domain-containing protein [Solirubrobacteraceae bacterium]|nr:lysylphosphatidylglycerol synthase transmembrane domain-containing protein [Solirubrobacteraceae bacterium]
MSSTGATLEEVRRGELGDQPELDQRRLRRRLVILLFAVVVIVAIVTLVPGLASLRTRFSHARWEWLVLGVALKLLSGLSYVAVFRAVFCPRMTWRLSTEIGLSELGANAVVPTGGAGGLALGAWALRRTGMPGDRIARRSVAFFLLTSLPNVIGVVVLGALMAVGVIDSPVGLALTALPAAVAAGAIVATLAAGRWARAARHRAARTRGPRAKLPRVLDAIAGGVRESLQLLREHNAWLVVGLIGYLAFDVMILWATFRAFGAAPALSVIWIGYLIGELGGLIPVPGGIGGVDLGLVGTLVLYHVPATSATAAVLAYRALALWTPAIAGSAAFLLLRRTLRRETLALSDCAEGGEVEMIGRGRVRVSG